MLPGSVEARAKMKMTFLQTPFKSFAVVCRRSSAGMEAARPIRPSDSKYESFMTRI
jgi:hypothetical protein